ncbi:putative adhesin [Yersinia sp. 2466 StPb PI]|uniref:putative adhesin n=1 Tax=Yersinia sp. 2466 StPb PI TaxID=3061648 RepID=UPI00355C8F13
MSIKNVVIKSLNFNARKALLLSHGGYTPQRDFIRNGSGMVCVPAGATLFFNSDENRPSIGTKAFHVLQGYPLAPVEIKQSGSIINNYSLEYNEIFERLKPTIEYDLISISPRGKAHMSDIFKMMQLKNKRYDIIHSVACRINKLTYNF